MLIVGELINTSRQKIKSAVEKRDSAYIQRVALDQIKAGAHYIDVNCATMMEGEPESMKWLVETIQKAGISKLCIDTPNPQALEVGLGMVENAQPMVNSITAEKQRYEAVLPLVLKYKAKVVALCIDDKGLPETAKDRIPIAEWLVENLSSAGVPEDDIYLDPLVKPIGTNASAGVEVLETIRFIRENYPKVHVICGLSNISFGLPNRKVLNQVFMVQTMTAGMDSYILNPLDKVLMGFFYASKALLGKDPYCRDYLSAYRRGIYS